MAYGYVRVPDGLPDDDLARTVEALKRFAEIEGYCYATTFFEHQDGSRAAFDELIGELGRAESRLVVVPTLDHLSSHRILRSGMIERLEADADAYVLAPGDAS